SLLTAIREAFTSGFAGAAIVCAVLMVVLAAVALLLFRHVPKSGQEPAPAAESIPDEVAAA
ncbi:MFS transporter, partial [Amycolatopsis sp. SID8362]|nr:MFS transporter [Amycolatopsis sp. SID8362]NED43042.1 MFS transporter [Amycolatopsis sp. SID8362]